MCSNLVLGSRPREISQTGVPLRSLLPSMSSAPLAAFIGWSPVAILLDPASDSSCISSVLVHKLNLPRSFGISGIQLATAGLHVPTDDSGYDSRLSFAVSYGLASDIILGNCEPILSNDRSRFLRPLTSTADRLQSPHLWRLTNRSRCPLDLTLTLPLTSHPASIGLAKSLRDDVEAREALASLVKGCCSNALFCSETVADRCIPTADREPRNAFLHQLFNGLCVAQSNVPGCREITHDSFPLGFATTAHA